MNARSSFLALVAMASVPLLSLLAGLYKLLTAFPTVQPSPVADLCLLAYKRVLDLGGHLVLLAVAAMLAIFVIRVLSVTLHSWRDTHRVDRLLQRSRDAAATAELRSLCRTWGLPSNAIEVIDSPAPQALTIGYMKPRVIASSRLVEMLTADELAAVIRHELAHAARKDPLRVVIADCVALGLPLVPLIRRLAHHFKARIEVEADAAATGTMGTPVPLAAALLKLLEFAQPTAGVGLNPTEARIDALLGRSSPSPGLLSLFLPSFISTVLIATTAVVLFLLASDPATVTLHICPN